LKPAEAADLYPSDSGQIPIEAGLDI